jgi:tetratricopeptide (TPR) repeat protein
MKDLTAAEADLRVMNDKRAKIQCRSGEAIHDRAWLRLGDFYRDQLHDEARALEAYLQVCDRTTWDYWGRPRKPAARGADQTLVAATDAACAILERQGKKDEVQKLRVNLLEARAEAAAGVLDRKEMLARFAEVLAIPGLFTAEHTAVEKQVESLEPAARNAALARVAPEAAGLSEDVRSLLLETVRDGDAAARRTALRTLVRFVPAEKIGTTVTTAAAEARKQAVQSSLEPKIRRLRELTGAKEWQKLVDEFKGVDFAAWEDSRLASDALQLRGMAYFNLKNGKQAEADIKKGLELVPTGATTERWYWLAENYQQNLKDDGRALDAYKKAGGRGGLWATYDANLKAAAILMARKQNDEALKILRSAEIDGSPGAWREKTLAAKEAVLVALGRRDDAVAEYRRVLALPNVTPAEKAAFEKRLAALGTGK